MHKLHQAGAWSYKLRPNFFHIPPLTTLWKHQKQRTQITQKTLFRSDLRNASFARIRLLYGVSTPRSRTDELKCSQLIRRHCLAQCWILSPSMTIWAVRVSAALGFCSSLRFFCSKEGEWIYPRLERRFSARSGPPDRSAFFLRRPIVLR